MPSLNEQEKIADFLLQFDIKVDFLNQQLEKQFILKIICCRIFSQEIKI
ncbi:MAG: restriction endonuclease subunit S [Methanosphaera stadtmanae]|nr:restriction endonuclease subunit S [Methanosphaera stadtmanae]